MHSGGGDQLADLEAKVQDLYEQYLYGQWKRAIGPEQVRLGQEVSALAERLEKVRRGWSVPDPNPDAPPPSISVGAWDVQLRRLPAAAAKSEDVRVWLTYKLPAYVTAFVDDGKSGLWPAAPCLSPLKWRGTMRRSQFAG